MEKERKKTFGVMYSDNRETSHRNKKCPQNNNKKNISTKYKIQKKNLCLKFCHCNCTGPMTLRPYRTRYPTKKPDAILTGISGDQHKIIAYCSWQHLTKQLYGQLFTSINTTF